MEKFVATPDQLNLVYGFLGQYDENHQNDWNFVMQIAKKILIDIDININQYSEQPGWIAYYSLESMLGNVDIQFSFRDCVEYIEWYNNLK
jgi:hypothetical protein